AVSNHSCGVRASFTSAKFRCCSESWQACPPKERMSRMKWDATVQASFFSCTPPASDSLGKQCSCCRRQRCQI
ncbi:hypothetical protein LEMLEM_LOCUS6928, partial [Lemmus lemmus]